MIHKLFFKTVLLFNCQLLQRAFFVASLLKFVFDVAFRSAHCLTALKCHIGLHGERFARFIRVQTFIHQMDQAHDGHQEHEEP